MKRQLLILLLCCCGMVWGQTTPPVDTAVQPTTISPPAPPTGVRAFDRDNDHGHAVTVTWNLSTDDKRVFKYELFRWVPAFLDTLDGIRTSLDDTRDSISNYERYVRHAKATVGDFSGAQKKAVEDSIALCQARIPEFKRLIKDLNRRLEEANDRLPEVHKTYPDNGTWRAVGSVPAGQSRSTNEGSRELTAGDYLPDFCDFYYRVDATTTDPAVRSLSQVVGPVQSKGQWFNTGRTAVLVAVLFFAALTVIFVAKARKGHDLYVRPLAGIEAVDDAIGRATEMGKPILYILGAGTASDIATLASFTILSRVSKKVAEYQTTLIVPCYDPIVMSVAQDIVKTGYADAGRSDAYKEDTVFFITQSQFAYVAAVNGIMLRDLPATNLYLGKFYAESLIFAETGAQAGSIQIAGTDEVAQIPFFVVACDYTLIGEELFAASAYLGREPLLLGTLKAQDYAKAAIMILAILGLLAVNVGHAADAAWLLKFKELFKVID
jgi:hypothetical protein